MSEYHILDETADGKGVNAVFHIPNVTGLNEVNTPYPVAYIEFMGGEVESVLISISDEEAAQLATGMLIEREVFVRYASVSGTAMDNLERLHEQYNATQAQIEEEIPRRLKYWGYKGDQ